jgi:ankyrin repeat protein
VIACPAAVVFAAFVPSSSKFEGMKVGGPFGILAGMVVCFFAGRAAWRALASSVAGGSQTRPQPPAPAIPPSGSLARRVSGVESSSPQHSRGEQVPTGGSRTRPQAPVGPAIPPSGTLARAWHEWWAERDRWFTVAVQTVLILLHFVCLIMFLSFGFSGRDVEGRRATSVRIGLPSPWFTYETYPEPNVPFRQHIDFFSSSLLVAAVGFLAFYVYWRIEKTKADFKPGFWNTPKPMLIVWAMLAVAAIVMMLSFAWIDFRPKPATPDSAPPKTGAEKPASQSQLDANVAALLVAAANGQSTRVKQLLDAGASVNAKDADGQTPLMKAVAGGHRSLAITLVLLGADLTEQDQHGLTALMIAAAQRDRTFLSKLRELSQISYEQDAQKRQEKLRAFPGVDRALIAGRDIDRQGIGLHDAELVKDDRGENALMKAARAGDWECFDLLANQVDSLLARDKLGQTVLMHAVLGGHAEQSDWFENDGWLTKPPYFGTAGMANVFIGRMLIFELERGLSLLDNDGKSVLQLADEHGHKEIAGILRRHLEAIVANQTAAIEKGDEGVPANYRLRGLAWRALGQKDKAESDLKQSTPK